MPRRLFVGQAPFFFCSTPLFLFLAVPKAWMPSSDALIVAVIAANVLMLSCLKQDSTQDEDEVWRAGYSSETLFRRFDPLVCSVVGPLAFGGTGLLVLLAAYHALVTEPSVHALALTCAAALSIGWGVVLAARALRDGPAAAAYLLRHPASLWRPGPPP